MKQNLLPLIAFFMFLSIGISQNADRIEISGKVIVDANDVEGLTISNVTSKRIAVTDMNGEFNIYAALNDKIEISALQFETVYMIITKEIMSSKQLTVFLNERLTTLDEVVILPFSLTGELALDLNKIKLHNPKFENFYFREIDIEDNPNAEIYYQKVENTILNQDRFYNGVDFVKITNWLIKPLFKSNKNTYLAKDNLNSNYLVLREAYTKDFISSSFNIPVDEVDEFIAFAEANNTDTMLYEGGNDIELIEYLVNQSKLYLNSETLKN
ncbi:peptidase associated/transthyretin-like domain-containing protein [Formosa maritima]|uniref:Carboxypeptidase-like regulatory domain-containing protein n=1 Tax=Formosa maritima TaxID=2592046 RepID=A0A5D0G5H2_9FLAO|nr:hypothetical protein [Formosa maritima]TYA53212.1 hypothetical protein FVF61_11220 [Formosa maritima]